MVLPDRPARVPGVLSPRSPLPVAARSAGRKATVTSDSAHAPIGAWACDWAAAPANAIH